MTLAEALARLERAVARLEAAVERNAGQRAASRRAAGDLAERVDAALARIGRVLGEEG